MKIVIATPHYPPNYIGGTEQIAYRMANILRGKGHEVTVLCVESIHEPEGQFFARTQVEEGVQVNRLYFPADRNNNHYPTSYRNDTLHNWLVEKFREEQPDIVHLLSGYLITAVILEAAFACQIATAVTLLDYWFVCPRITLLRANGDLCAEPVPASRCAWCMLSDKRRYRMLDDALAGLPGKAYTLLGKNPAFRLLMGADGKISGMQDRRDYLKKMLEQADVVVSHSHFLQEKIRENGIFTDNVMYLPNGIQVDETPLDCRPSHPSPLRIGYIGQIARHKGVHLLVEAFIAAGADPRLAELHIYGDGSRWPAYMQALKDKAGGHPAILFKGTYPAEQVTRVLDQLDVLVVPSIWFENRPTVILEAFSRRIPVVVADMGGMAEMVLDEMDGLRFRPGDVKSLTQQLKRLIDDPDELGRLCAGIQPVRSVQVEMDEIERLYEKVIQQRQQANVQIKPLR